MGTERGLGLVGGRQWREALAPCARRRMGPLSFTNATRTHRIRIGDQTAGQLRQHVRGLVGQVQSFLRTVLRVIEVPLRRRRGVRQLAPLDESVALRSDGPTEPFRCVGTCGRGLARWDRVEPAPNSSRLRGGGSRGEERPANSHKMGNKFTVLAS